MRVGSCSLKFDRLPQVHCGHHHQWLHCTMAHRDWDTASISTENIVDAPHKLGTTSTMQQDRVLTARGVTNCQILTPFDGGCHSSWHLKFDSSRTFQKLPGGAVRQLGKSRLFFQNLPEASRRCCQTTWQVNLTPCHVILARQV